MQEWSLRTPILLVLNIIFFARPPARYVSLSKYLRFLLSQKLRSKKKICLSVCPPFPMAAAQRTVLAPSSSCCSCILSASCDTSATSGASQRASPRRSDIVRRTTIDAGVTRWRRSIAPRRSLFFQFFFLVAERWMRCSSEPAARCWHVMRRLSAESAGATADM